MSPAQSSLQQNYNPLIRVNYIQEIPKECQNESSRLQADSIQQLSNLQNIAMQSNRRPISQSHAIVQDHLLGKGSTGNVYLGYQLHPPHSRVAVKAIDLKTIDNEVTKYLLGCQITALTELSRIGLPGHDHVVKLLEVATQGDHIYLVTELLEGGTLAELIKSHPGGLPEEEGLALLRQMLEGYLHIANKNIIHRDLKPDNMLFRGKSRPGSLAIIDFGYCQMEEVANAPQVYYNVGSPKYMAPEAYRQNKYSQKSDIWALGVILYEMVVGKTCDEGHTMESYLQMVASKGIPLPSHLSPFVKQLLAAMLCESSHNRFTCLQVLRLLKQYQSGAQQSQIVLEQPQGRNSSLVFRSVMMSPISTSPKAAQIVNSQFLTAERESSLPRQPQTIEPPHTDRKLIKSRSANIMPIVSFKNMKPEVESALRRVENMQLVQVRVEQKQVQEHRSIIIQQVSPKAFQIRGPSPCRINFKFVSQPNTPSQPLHPYPNNSPRNLRVEQHRQVRVVTQPRKEQPDQNLRIQAKQQSEDKLVGGFTLMKHLNNQRVVRNIPQAHHFVCRKEMNNLYPHRQISLPKSIPH